MHINFHFTNITHNITHVDPANGNHISIININILLSLHRSKRTCKAQDIDDVFHFSYIHYTFYNAQKYM